MEMKSKAEREGDRGCRLTYGDEAVVEEDAEHGGPHSRVLIDGLFRGRSHNSLEPWAGAVRSPAMHSRTHARTHGNHTNTRILVLRLRASVAITTTLKTKSNASIGLKCGYDMKDHIKFVIPWTSRIGFTRLGSSVNRARPNRETPHFVSRFIAGNPDHRRHGRIVV
ncbi:hypothetical protein BHE74_00000446 [Ensete ventricosum]|nr:hypothetical protein BHE74_00000446 [Ensete ventricosum]